MGGVIGLDVGGANTKAVWRDGDERRVASRPFEIWSRGVDGQVFTICNLRQRPREVVVAKTETVHPRVDLEVTPQPAADVVVPRRNSKGGLTLV